MHTGSAADFFSEFSTPFKKVLQKLSASLLAVAMASFGSAVPARGEWEGGAIAPDPVAASDPGVGMEKAEAIEQIVIAWQANQLVIETMRATQPMEQIPEMNPSQGLVEPPVDTPEVSEDPPPQASEPSESQEPPVAEAQDPPVAQEQPRLTLRQITERAVARRLIRKYLTDGIKRVVETVITQTDERLKAFLEWLRGLTGGGTP